MSELTTIKCHKCKRIIMQVALVPGTHIVHRCHCNAWNTVTPEKVALAQTAQQGK